MAQIRRFGAELNNSIGGGLDASMLSYAGGGACDIDTTARLNPGARASLSASQFGRGSFVKPGGAPPSTKKPAFPAGRPSLALQMGDRCAAAGAGGAAARALGGRAPPTATSSARLLFSL